MSEVISFRLDEKNPREAKAIHILYTWKKNGYSVRHILTEALLSFDLPGKDYAEKLTGNGFNEIINNLNQIRRLVEDGLSNYRDNIDQADFKPALSNTFTSSIQLLIKPGLTCSDK